MGEFSFCILALCTWYYSSPFIANELLSLIFCSYYQAGICKADAKAILIIGWMAGTRNWITNGIISIYGNLTTLSCFVDLHWKRSAPHQECFSSCSFTWSILSIWSFQWVIFRCTVRAQCCFFCAGWGRGVSSGALLVLIFWGWECSKWNQFRETLNLSTLSVWSSRDPMLCRKHFPGISIFYIWEVISVLKLLWQKLLGGCF